MSEEMREQQFMGSRYKKPLLEKPIMPMKKTLFNHPNDMMKKQSLLGSPPPVVDRHRWPATKRGLEDSPRSSPTYPNPPKRQALLPTPGEPVGLLPRPSGLLPAPPSSPRMYSPPSSPNETLVKQPLLPSVSVATHSPPPGLLPLPRIKEQQMRCVEPAFQKPALLQTPPHSDYQKQPSEPYKKNSPLLPLLMPEQPLKAPLLKVPAMTDKAPLLHAPNRQQREPLIPTPPVVRGTRLPEFYPPKMAPVYPPKMAPVYPAPAVVKRPLLPTPSLLF